MDKQTVMDCGKTQFELLLLDFVNFYMSSWYYFLGLFDIPCRVEL